MSLALVILTCLFILFTVYLVFLPRRYLGHLSCISVCLFHCVLIALGSLFQNRVNTAERRKNSERIK